MKKIIFILLAVSLVSCNSSIKGLVIPREDGSYQVQATSNTSDRALQDALNSAQEVCRKNGARHIVKDTHTDYEGNIPESTRFLGRLPVTSIIAKSTYRATVIFMCK